MSEPGVPDRSRPSRRRAPPASPGLLASSGISEDRYVRLRKKHPARVKGVPRAVHMSTIVEAALANMTATKPKTPSEVAIAVGADVSGASVKDVIKKAKERFLRRIDEYVDAHLLATQNAALKGNAEPAQWALERISEGGMRVVDPPNASAPQHGAVSIGVVIGGIPQPRVTTATIDTTAKLVEEELPALGPVPEEDMP